ncbi:MAG: hypothetical protein ACI9YL_000238 [Luteibaculaceae bacterium]|jgi:hypothetical protein
MKRRSFIKRVGLTSTAAFIAPYILPSGRLFASTGYKKADHVVYVMFGGGVRQQESVRQQYLAGSQGVDIEGNIMPNLFSGAAPDAKIVYGGSSTLLPGDTPSPMVVQRPLQEIGALFPEVEASSTGHYGGFVGMLQGNTMASQGLKQRPISPTIFEYLRKFGDYKASDVWFVADTIMNSIPLLNHSSHPEFGAPYGANMYAPKTTFGSPGYNAFGDQKIYHPSEQMDPVYLMQNFIDDHFLNIGPMISHLENDSEEKRRIKEFMKGIYDNHDSPNVIGTTTRILQEFKPAMLAMNFFTGVDSAHGDFTGGMRALHAADNVIGQLWNVIQSIPEMQDNTIMIVTPEHGRNLEPNAIKDENDWGGFDHSDANSKKVWTMMLGPGIPAGVHGSIESPMGYTVDNVPTIAEILGVKDQVINAGYLAGHAKSLFDRM